MINRRQFRLFVFYPIFVISLLIFLVWLMTPVIAKHLIKDFFQQHQMRANIDDLEIDFFSPRVLIQDVTLQKADQTTLSLGEAEVAVNLWPLFTKQISITQLQLKDVNFTLTQTSDRWIVAGLDLQQFSTTDAQDTTTPTPNMDKQTPTDSESASWKIILPKANFDNVFVDWTHPNAMDQQPVTDRLGIQALTLENLQGQDLDWQTDLSLEAQLNQAEIKLNAQLSFMDQVAQVSLNSLAADVNMQHVKHFLPVAYQGEIRLDAALEASYQPAEDDDLKQAAHQQIKLNNANIKLALKDLDLPLSAEQKLQLKQAEIAFNTKQFRYDLAPNSAPVVSLDSELDLSLTQGNYQDSAQQIDWQDLRFQSPIKLDQKGTGYQLSTPTTELNLSKLAVNADTLVLDADNLAWQLQNLQVNADITEQTLDTLSATVSSQIDSQQVNVKQAGNQVSYQSLALANDIKVAKTPQQLDILVEQLSFEIQTLIANLLNEQALSLQQASLTADQVSVAQDQDKESADAPAIQGKGIQLQTKAFDSKLHEDKQLISWDSSQLQQLNFSQQGDTFSSQFEQLEVTGIRLSKWLKKPSLPPLADINKLQIQTLTADQTGAQINQIKLDGVQAKLLLDKDQNIENLVSFNSDQAKLPEPSLQGNKTPKANDLKTTTGEATNPPQAKVTDSAFKAPYQVALDSFTIDGESFVYVEDKSITPSLKRTLDIERFQLSNLDTRNAEQATDIELQARNGKYTKLDSKTKIWPLASRLTMQTQLTIEEAELPPYSAYLASVLGYQIDSGQLDLSLKLDAEQGKLSGNSNILLRDFDLGGRQESSSVIKAGAVPLNIAVSILKDSDNNIDLDIPLSGDIDNPEFGWRNFLFLPVRKALYTASSNYLMQTFIPYANVISIAQLAGDQLLKIRVEPLVFNATQAQLSEDQQGFLGQLSQLMKDKEDSQLKACGVTSFSDLGFTSPPAELSEEQKTAARQLAEDRANNLKDYLVNSGIRSSRILLCSPEIDLSKNSKPRVELNF